MPHQVHERKFGRTTDQRRAMLRNLTVSILRYERVKTTEAKAKEIRGFVDRMINLGKDGSLEARRRALAWLPEPVIVDKVFTDLAKRYEGHPSGYVRTTHLARRVGDSARLMLIELLPGVEEAKPGEEEKPAPRRRRLSLRRGEKTRQAGAPPPPVPAKAESGPAKKRTTARKKTAAKEA